jgi:hypothetical protein
MNIDAHHFTFVFSSFVEPVSNSSHRINTTIDERKTTDVQPYHASNHALVPAQSRLMDSSTDMTYRTDSILNQHESILNIEHGQQKDALLSVQRQTSTKEGSNFLSISHHGESSSSMNTTDTFSFRSALENTVEPSEPIYENLPIRVQMNSHQATYYTQPIRHGTQSMPSDDHVYVDMTNENASNSSSQQISVNSQTLSIDKSHEHSRGQSQILFADRLTNPMFEIDKQLLANTIANQFGVDLSSPYLQQLIDNQHVFASQKRTFANMIWPLSSEELRVMCCSSPIDSKLNLIQTDGEHSNKSKTKSILKTQRPFRLNGKRSRITWNTDLDS